MLSEDNGGSSAQLNWFPAIKINVTDEQIADDLNDEDNVTHSIIDEVNLTLIRSEVVVSKLENEKHENVIKAESQHSDLLPAVYEGIVLSLSSIDLLMSYDFID